MRELPTINEPVPMLDLAPEEIVPLLAGRSRPEAGATAPPWGLYLVSVSY